MGKEAGTLPNRGVLKQPLKGIWTTTIGNVTATALGGAIGTLGVSQTDAPPITQPAGDEPLEFENDLQIHVHHMINPVKQYLLKLTGNIKKRPDTDPIWDKYDDKEFQEIRDNWEEVEGQLADSGDLPEDAEMAAELERFIWACWILTRLHHWKTTKKSFGKPGDTMEVEEEVYEHLGGDIDDRLVALKIEKQEDTDLHPREEDTKLIAWAKRYLDNVKPWVSGKMFDPAVQTTHRLDYLHPPPKHHETERR